MNTFTFIAAVLITTAGVAQTHLHARKWLYPLHHYQGMHTEPANTAERKPLTVAEALHVVISMCGKDKNEYQRLQCHVAKMRLRRHFVGRNKETDRARLHYRFALKFGG